MKNLLNKNNIIIACIILVNAVLWIIPSNITKLISKGKPILMGRYSVERLTLLFALIPISLLAIYIFSAVNKKKRRIRIFQVVTLAITFFIGLIMVDTVLRFKREARYVKTDDVVHRKPNKVFNLKIEDKPEFLNAHQESKIGYPSFDCILTTDKHGFRNKEKKEKYDIIVIGDSFTEGTDVTDDEIWAQLLAKKSEKSLYNLGMSGTDPIDYLKALKRFGTDLKPSVVICTIYEGNDFASIGSPEDRMKLGIKEKNKPLSEVIRKFFKYSPIRKGIKPYMIKAFAQVAKPEVAQVAKPEVAQVAKPEVAQVAKPKVAQVAKPNVAQVAKNDSLADSLSWLPLNIAGKNYYFPPKRMLSFYTNEKKFKKSNGWRNVKYAIDNIKKVCDDNNIKLYMVYAPTKPNVVLPLYKDKINEENFRNFALLKADDLPNAKSFKKKMFDAIGVQAKVIDEYCQELNIEFIDLAPPLREKVKQGEQIYFTYDQHWSPKGNEEVAKIIYNTINKKYNHGK